MVTARALLNVTPEKMITRLMLAGVVLISLLSCEPAPEDLFVRHFVIPKGKHYATPRLVEMLQSDRLIFTAKFDASAIYEFGDESLQSNKNKLLGFADCNSMHHENSARFAWQWFNNQLEIYAYCYVNSERVENYVGTVNINEVNRYAIQLTDSHYVFYLNGEEAVRVDRANRCDKGVYYMLWPYFGGSQPAPHDVRIDISIKR